MDFVLKGISVSPSEILKSVNYEFAMCSGRADSMTQWLNQSNQVTKRDGCTLWAIHKIATF